MEEIKENEYITINEASKNLDKIIFNHAEELGKNLRKKRIDNINNKSVSHV